MIKTVIFDFDGTIADTLPRILQLYNKYASDFGLNKITSPDAEFLRGKSTLEIIKWFGITAIKLPALAVKIRKELNSSITSIKIFPGIKELIKKLKSKKYKLGVLTSNSVENVVKFLKKYRIDSFDFIISEPSLLGKAKAIKNLINNQKLNKDKTIYIGDEVRDIDACKENGIKVISVTWGFNTKYILQKNNPDFIAGNPAKILKILSI